jgi:hypothetical protein
MNRKVRKPNSPLTGGCFLYASQSDAADNEARLHTHSQRGERLSSIEFSNDFRRIKSDDSPQLDQLDYVDPALTRFQMSYPRLVDPELFSQIHLTQASTFPQLDQHGGELLLKR